MHLVTPMQLNLHEYELSSVLSHFLWRKLPNICSPQRLVANVIMQAHAKQLPAVIQHELNICVSFVLRNCREALARRMFTSSEFLEKRMEVELFARGEVLHKAHSLEGMQQGGQKEKGDQNEPRIKQMIKGRTELIQRYSTLE